MQKIEVFRRMEKVWHQGSVRLSSGQGLSSIRELTRLTLELSIPVAKH